VVRHRIVGFSWQPVFTDVSPAGSIAYMRLTKPLTEKDSSDLYVVDAATGETTPIHEGTGFSVWPQWSPDGSRIAYTSDETPEGTNGVFVANADGSGVVNGLAGEMQLEGPGTLSWSPDGSRIVFAKTTVEYENRDYGQDVFVMDADGSNERRITDWKGFDSFAVWSPDGEWIAFASDRDATPEQREGNSANRPLSGVSIHVMHSDGSSVHRLAEGGAVAL